MANGDSPANKGALSTLLLPAALAALAIAVAILAWVVFARSGVIVEVDGLLTEEEFRKRMDTVDAAHGEISKSVEKRVTTEHFDKRIDELKELLTRCCNRTNPRLEVMFENARLRGKSSLDEESPGIALSVTQEEELGKLAGELVACAAPPSESVRLKVQGYSSTRPFKGVSEPISNELNLKVANLRAVVVVNRLADGGAVIANDVHVKHEPWQRYEDIQRPFDDKAGLSGTDRERLEQLNRVVYIDLLDDRGCERTT